MIRALPRQLQLVRLAKWLDVGNCRVQFEDLLDLVADTTLDLHPRAHLLRAVIDNQDKAFEQGGLAMRSSEMIRVATAITRAAEDMLDAKAKHPNLA
jgi:hypothetical protein